MADRAIDIVNDLSKWLAQHDLTNEDALVVLVTELLAMIKSSPAPEKVADTVISTIRENVS